MNIQDLKNKVLKANEAYRNGNAIISDEEYDAALETLEEELDFIEFAEFKQSLTENKGTVSVAYVLGSLTKYKYEELDKFMKWLETQRSNQLLCSDKIDGCSFYAEYRKGKLTLLSSRGDGAEGTDWTAKASYINIPILLNEIVDIDVRGEVTLTGNSHEVLGYKNLRNGTAGIMNNKDIDATKLKHIHAYAYEVLSGEHTILDQFSLLKNLGFKTASYVVVHKDQFIVENIKKYYLDRKAQAEYNMDGIVICGVDYIPENEFFPKNKIAFKINSTGVQTVVKGIEWNISKGGLLKPVVLLEAVEIDGTTVQRATGNNYQYLMDNKIGMGAVVSIIKSGEIIPKIIKVMKGGVVNLPSNCPSCGNNLDVVGVDIKCNNVNCGEVLVKSLASFLIKAGVEGVTATSLENWNVRTFEQLVSFVSDGSKAQSNFVKEIKEKIFSKTQEQLFACMTFNGAGETNINKIIDFYGKGNLVTATKAIYQMPRIELTEFPDGIGQKVIDKIYTDWKQNLRNLRNIVLDSRFKPVAPVAKVVNTNSKIAGKSFCITGTLTKGRKEFEKMITDNGGVLASVSKKLDFLLVGTDAGSKEDKAKSLGVKILNETEFMGMI